MKKLQILIVSVVLLFGVSAARAQYTISVQQVGNDVVATGSGSINLTGLNFLYNGANCNPNIQGATGIIEIGAFGSNCTGYVGVSSPGPFGGGGLVFANSGTGGHVGLAGSTNQGRIIQVPFNYVSGTPFTSSSTWTNTTIAGLGLREGFYRSTWNNGAGSLTYIIGQPATTAAVSIGGRVLTNTNRGLANAVVYLTDSDGETRTARTNPFGYYRFSDIAAGQTVVVTVISKRYQFAPQVLSVTEAIEDLNFAALAPLREK